MFVTKNNEKGLEGDPDMYGVLVHANIISTILKD